MEKLKVILDCDDVLFECNSEVIRKINQKNMTDRSMNELTKWGTGDDDPEIGYEVRKNYFQDPEFVRKQPCAEGAAEFVKKLLEIADVSFCTAVPNQCKDARMEAIKKSFPFMELENVIFQTEKNQLVADFMLDDAPHNLTSPYVRYPVLYRRPWNRTDYRFAVSSLDSFLMMVNMAKHIDHKPNVPKIIAMVGSPRESLCMVKKILRNDEHIVSVISDKDILTALDRGKYPLVITSFNQIIELKKSFGKENVVSFNLFGNEKDMAREVLREYGKGRDALKAIRTLKSEMHMSELCDYKISQHEAIRDIAKEIIEKGRIA